MMDAAWLVSKRIDYVVDREPFSKTDLHALGAVLAFEGYGEGESNQKWRVWKIERRE